MQKGNIITRTRVKSVKNVPEGQFWSPNCPVCGAPEGPDGFEYVCRSVEGHDNDPNRWAEMFKYECAVCGAVVPIYCWSGDDFNVPVLLKRSQLTEVRRKWEAEGKLKHFNPRCIASVRVVVDTEAKQVVSVDFHENGHAKEDIYVDTEGKVIPVVQIAEDQ